MEKALAIELSANMAIFRRGYTTTSTLTYIVPPKTTVEGLLAAMVGKDFDTYYEMLNDSRIAIVVTAPIRTVMITQNLLFGKSGQETVDINTLPRRTQVTFQYLMAPRYRIYFYDSGPFYDELKNMLKNGSSYYTPYLGSAHCIAAVRYLGEASVSEMSPDGHVDIHSILPLDIASASSLDLDTAFRQGLRVIREDSSSAMNNERVVQHYSPLLIAQPPPGRNASYPVPIRISSGRYWKVSTVSPVLMDENVIFF